MVDGRFKINKFPSDIDYEEIIECHKVLTQHHYEHYEVFFYKKKKFSRHNTSYWLQNSYLGLTWGTFFDGEYRSQNVSNNQLYLKNLDFGHILQTSEALSLTEKMMNTLC